MDSVRVEIDERLWRFRKEYLEIPQLHDEILGDFK
jgi:hypothetical protein